MPFVKGQSGNPAGRPVGSRNRFTQEMQEALENSGLPLIQRLLELAGDGNTGAMRQCLDRLMGKYRPSAVALPSPDAPNYVLSALSEIHRALGAGEIASDEAARLVDFVGRTGRVLAAKAIAEINFANRLARCEEALPLDAGKAAAAESILSEVVPALAPQATAAGAIDNNNAKTMKPTPAPNEAPPLDPRVAAALDKAVQATLPRRRHSVKQQLLSSASPAALLIGDITEKVLAGKTAPVMPPRMPLATAA
jgi:Family of unknown function (DUF5681)